MYPYSAEDRKISQGQGFCECEEIFLYSVMNGVQINTSLVMMRECQIPNNVTALKLSPE